MNLVTAIIDHNLAAISERELFACNRVQADRIYREAVSHPDILGAVLLNTCNRTELYLSLSEQKEDFAFRDEQQETDPYLLLCRSLDLEAGRYEGLVRRITGEEVLTHLCLLSAGALSQLRGDSQIITQVSDALADAQERGASDAVLNTVFRLGITAGKKVRTNIQLRMADHSTVDRAVARIAADPEIKKVLVIGNGVIGRLVSKELVDRGLQVTMTLRQYHNREAVIPYGVQVVPYGQRYEAMADRDAVVSATASPHVVITKEGLLQAERYPKLMIDMAVPRDIEPAIGNLPGMICLNIDELSKGEETARYQRRLSELREYVSEYIEELHRWEDSRRRVEKEIQRLSDSDRDRAQRRYFPLFIDSRNRLAVVIGGGNIAQRRVLTLIEFGFRVRVVSKHLSRTLRQLVQTGTIEFVCRRVQSDGNPAIEQETIASCDIAEAVSGAWMVLACTNKRELNREIGRWCRDNGLLVNVCDARRESAFWFPAVGLSDELTMGLVGTGNDHKNVRLAARKLREVIETKSYKEQ